MTKYIQWQEMPDFVIWNRLKHIRKNRKMTRAALAIESGVSMTYLTTIEQGLDNGVSEVIQGRIAAALNVPVNAIFPVRVKGMIILKTGERLTAAKPKKSER